MSDQPFVIPRQGRPYQGERAGLVTRSIAGTVDAAVVSAAVIATYLGLTAARFVVDPRGFEPVQAPPSLIVVTGLVSCVVYLAAAWVSTGRTYGDRLMGLRVVRPGHRRIGVSRALLRALLCVWFPLGLLWSSSQSRRAVHDVLLGTCVIYDWASRPAAARAPAAR